MPLWGEIMKKQTRVPVVFRPLTSPAVECCSLCGAVAPRGSLCDVGLSVASSRARLLACPDCLPLLFDWMTSGSDNLIDSGVSSNLLARRPARSV